MRRIAILTAVWFVFQASAPGAVITCSATCLSKIASVVSVAANGKTIIAGAKKVRHPKKAKATK